MRWTIPYSSFRGASLHETILTPQSADLRFRRLEQKNSVTAEKGFASNQNDFSSSLKRFLVRTWSRDQLTPEHKVTNKTRTPCGLWTNKKKNAFELLFEFFLDDWKGRQKYQIPLLPGGFLAFPEWEALWSFLRVFIFYKIVYEKDLRYCTSCSKQDHAK